MKRTAAFLTAATLSGFYAAPALADPHRPDQSTPSITLHDCISLSRGFSTSSYPWAYEATIFKAQATLGCSLLKRDQDGMNANVDTVISRFVKFLQNRHLEIAQSHDFEIQENTPPDGIMGPNFSYDHIDVMAAYGIKDVFLDYEGNDLLSRSMRRFIQEIESRHPETYATTKAYMNDKGDADDYIHCEKPEFEDLRICGETRAHYQPETRPTNMRSQISFNI